MHLAILLLFASPAVTSLTPIDEAGFQKLVQSNKGKVVLYDFWATYCAPCRAETPELLKLERKLHGNGFVLVTISADEPESDSRAAKMAGELGITRPAYRKEAKKDEDFINLIDPKWEGALPAMFLYDKSGRRVLSFIGATDTATVEKAIQGTMSK
jgi:thiol-disulfide isomerase/thioredoxin